MRLLFSLSSFALTMILSLIVFTYAVINFPSTMHELYQIAGSVLDKVKSMELPDRYMVWVDIFLQPNQVVLVGISILVRFVLGLIGSIFETRTPPAPTPVANASNSPFSRWG